MLNINKVIIGGRLGQDPQMAATKSGTAVANLSVGSKRRVKQQDGSWGEETEWTKVVLFGQPAEFCGQYARKGSQVYIEGRLQTRKWQDQTGQDRYTTEVVADDFQLADSKGAGNQQRQPMQQPMQQPQQQQFYNAGYQSQPYNPMG